MINNLNYKLLYFESIEYINLKHNWYSQTSNSKNVGVTQQLHHDFPALTPSAVVVNAILVGQVLRSS